DEVMAIAATTYSDAHASYSNAGAEVEIAAPGGERNRSMISTWPGGVRCRDINAAPPQSDYCTSEGTSMAAAVVSGAAAMVKSLRPSLSATAIRQLFRTTAHNVNQPTNFVGSGRLDLQAALRQILPTALVLSQKSYLREVAVASAPYTVTLRLDNPSATVLDWNASLIAGADFVTFHGAISDTITSTVRYGAPVYLSLTISPTHLLTGSHAAALQITALQPDGARVRQFVDLSVVVWSPQALSYRYFPFMFHVGTTVTPATGYDWAMPTVASDRTSYQLIDNSNVALTLPFTFTLRSIDYTAARIYSDGFLRFPDATTGDSLPSHCLPNLTEPGQAIYGWWADLNPGAQGAQVSSFQPDDDRFVVEFANVPSANGVTPAYVVSFQIVLYRDGDVRLNYRQAPGVIAGAPPVTVGIEARDG
ncbi:MAG: S8 family serine peptidase, partial [Caldilineaceae bacterium]|nr:S8 family serine peptidase [Caldilineaceae bacterium]